MAEEWKARVSCSWGGRPWHPHTLHEAEYLLKVYRAWKSGKARSALLWGCAWLFQSSKRNPLWSGILETDFSFSSGVLLPLKSSVEFSAEDEQIPGGMCSAGLWLGA